MTLPHPEFLPAGAGILHPVWLCKYPLPPMWPALERVLRIAVNRQSFRVPCLCFPTVTAAAAYCR